jgi:dGTPase
MDELRSFLFERVYARSVEGESAAWVRRVIGELVDHFLAHPQEVPELPEPGPRAVVDYVAGMTDRYAERIWRQITSG